MYNYVCFIIFVSENIFHKKTNNVNSSSNSIELQLYIMSIWRNFIIANKLILIEVYCIKKINNQKLWQINHVIEYNAYKILTLIKWTYIY